MQYSYQVDVVKYESLSRPARLAVGDVIRCPAFRSGIVTNSSAASDKAVHVAWHSKAHFDSYLTNRLGTDATDESRGSAAFLVTSVTLEECCGPEDVGVGARLSRKVRAVRLTDRMRLKTDAEQIVFWLDDPLALASPNPDEIETLGCATLPVGWEY
jgi:hypothetical protein